jgi:hypothetical protein
MADKLIVKGLGGIDGEYEFDLAELVSLGEPGALTNREGHRIKTMAGVRVGELLEALQAGDNDVLIALAAIILARKGRRLDENLLWDAPIGAGVSFELDDTPDEQPGPTTPAPQPETVSPSRNGGESSSPSSAPPASDPSPTGTPDSETASPVLASVPETSET